MVIGGRRFDVLMVRPRRRISISQTNGTTMNSNNVNGRAVGDDLQILRQSNPRLLVLRSGHEVCLLRCGKPPRPRGRAGKTQFSRRWDRSVGDHRRERLVKRT